MSPVKRERESNRELPELFAYVNNFLHKKCIADGEDYYSKHSIRKFGYWLGDSKKNTHQELEELAGAGSSSKFIKSFNKTDVPTQLFVIFTTGGIDFVGGYNYFNFLKHTLGKEACLSKVKLAESTGEEVHSLVFSDKLKTPAHWKQIMSYF